MRSATPTFSAPVRVAGDPDAARAGAATVLEAAYDVPFQGHTSIGPAHALADPSNGQLTIYSNDMKSYGLRNGVAQFLQIPRDRVRVEWMEGPQAYGRTAADDAGFEAAFLAKELRPSRARAVEPSGRDGVGHEGARLRGQHARRARRPGQPDLPRMGRPRPGPQPRRLQRARHGAHRAADGPAEGDPGAWRFLHAGRHVRDPEQADGRARRRPAARVGDAAAHGQPARPQRSAGDVRLRVVHRRAGGGRQGGSIRVPHEDAAREHRRRQRLQAGALDCRAEGCGRQVRLDAAALSAACRRPARC